MGHGDYENMTGMQEGRIGFVGGKRTFRSRKVRIFGNRCHEMCIRCRVRQAKEAFGGRWRTVGFLTLIGAVVGVACTRSRIKGREAVKRIIFAFAFQGTDREGRHCGSRGKTHWWRCSRVYGEGIERLAFFGVCGGREAEEAGDGPLAGVGLGRRVEKGLAFVEEVEGGAKMVAGFKDATKVSDTCLSSRRDCMLRERDFGTMANSSRPGSCYEDVGCVRAMEGLGVVFCVKREILVLRETCRNIGIQLTTKSYDTYPFGSSGGGAFAKVDQI